MRAELESGLRTQASTILSRLTYFGVLLTCPVCGSVYSPKLYKCPSCGDRISCRKREELLRRVKAERIVEALNKPRLKPGDIYLKVYRRPVRKYKNPSLRNTFEEEVIKYLLFNDFIRLGEFDFVVLKQPSADEVYDALWGERGLLRSRVERKTERRQARYIDAVKEEGCWVVKRRRVAGGATMRSFLLNSPESEESAIEIAKRNPNTKYNFTYTNGYRPILERVDNLLFEVPNVGILTCSEYTWFERMRVEFGGLFMILKIPRGGLKRWGEDVCCYARGLLQIGENLGEVCKKLNAFNIKISVRGLLRWHWKDIGPPPGSTW